MTSTVGDVLSVRLRDWGVNDVFGYAGDGINGLLPNVLDPSSLNLTWSAPVPADEDLLRAAQVLNAGMRPRRYAGCFPCSGRRPIAPGARNWYARHLRFRRRHAASLSGTWTTHSWWLPSCTTTT